MIVLSSGFWRRRYGASREVVGRLVTLDDQRFRVVGIMPGIWTIRRASRCGGRPVRCQPAVHLVMLPDAR